MKKTKPEPKKAPKKPVVKPITKHFERAAKKTERPPGYYL